MEVLPGWLVNALIRVGAEIVTLGLQQVCREYGTTVAVVIGQGRTEGGYRNAMCYGSGDNFSHGAIVTDPLTTGCTIVNLGVEFFNTVTAGDVLALGATVHKGIDLADGAVEYGDTISVVLHV